MLNNYRYIKIICIFLIVFLCLESINILYLHNLQKNNSSFDKQEKICSDNLILIQPQEEKEELSLYNSSFSSQNIVYLQEEVEQEQKEEICTLYTSLTKEEIELIELTVQHEVGNFSKDYKKLIAAIIRNRLESDSFPNTISEVILAEGQFSNGDYVGVNVDIETQEAVEEVFSMEESPHPATYYYNPELSSYSSIYWFEYSGDIEYLFSYSEEDWGIIYTTRFFI